MHPLRLCFTFLHPLPTALRDHAPYKRHPLLSLTLPKVARIRRPEEGIGHLCRASRDGEDQIRPERPSLLPKPPPGPHMLRCTARVSEGAARTAVST